MDWDFSTHTNPRARKEYPCQAFEWINNMMCRDDLTDAEKVIYDAAKKEDFRILKGALYLKTCGVYDGEFQVFRARPDMNTICEKYDLYEL